MSAQCLPVLAEGMEEGSDLAGIIPEAYRFLLEQGCINAGLPAGEPPHVRGQEDDAKEEEGVPEEALVAAVYALLKKVDMEVGARA